MIPARGPQTKVLYSKGMHITRYIWERFEGLPKAVGRLWFQLYPYPFPYSCAQWVYPLGVKSPGV